MNKPRETYGPHDLYRQYVDHLGNPIDPEFQRYLGVLYVQRDALMEMLKGCGGGEINDATLENERIEVTWASGDRCTLGWETVRERAGLHHLPPPDSAFAPDGSTIGLVIHSDTPRQGLSYREPHSVIHPIGTLTSGGLLPQP